MIVVGGGSSSRFGSEKLLQEIAGQPLVTHTIAAMTPHVDKCVLVARADLVEIFSDLGLGVEVVAGGSTRTLSEMAGLSALGGAPELIGIHDAARPVVDGGTIELLFETAARVGGAVPVVEPHDLLVDRHWLTPMDGVVRAQTPQVFQGPGLMAAFVKLAQSGGDAHDTVEVVHNHGDLRIAAVPGDADNLKVTFPEDLERVRSILTDPSRT